MPLRSAVLAQVADTVFQFVCLFVSGTIPKVVAGYLRNLGNKHIMDQTNIYSISES